jgi:glycosyltransferase involved in cell wall biosynthesis
MLVTGLDGFSPPAGVESTGRVDRSEFLGLLRRSRVFAAAPTREGHGIAALEALAAGCQLVTTPAQGPYPALEIARTADPRLVAADIAPAIRFALDDPLSDYRQRVGALLEPFSTAASDRAVAEVVLPSLLTGWRQPSETRA